MDEERIKQATREGPLGEPAYVPIRNFARYARTAVPRNGRRDSQFALGGLARLVATVLVAVLIVVALAVIRSGSATPEPIPVASAPAPSPLHAAPSQTSAASSTAFPSSAASPIPASPATASLVSPPLASAAASSLAAVADTGDAVGVGVGLYHSCALMRAGGVKCWGFDSIGQLGNGSHTSANTPADVVGLGTGIRAIRAGVLDTCAVTTTGGVKCWGSNQFGQLGDGTTVDRNVPVDVIGLDGRTVDVSVGDAHACAITSGGSVKCWGGFNLGFTGIGVLGNGSDVSSAIPVDVTGLTRGVIALAAGANHTCALKNDGTVMCWGDNSQGQLGVSMTTKSANGGICGSGNDPCASASFVPVQVNGLRGPVTAIAAGGDRTCAIASGRVECWGADSGTDGNGNPIPSSTPASVTGVPAGSAGLSVGAHASCLIDGTGAAMCWGANAAGQLGDGTRKVRAVPVAVVGLAGSANVIAMDDTHACAVTTGGAVECWGANSQGQLGGGVGKGGSPTPVVVEGL